MITRTHTKGDAPSTAIYSDCEKYRYSLTRVWDPVRAQGAVCHVEPVNRNRSAERPDG